MQKLKRAESVASIESSLIGAKETNESLVEMT